MTRTLKAETREASTGALSDVRTLKDGQWISIQDLGNVEHLGRHKGKDRWRVEIAATTIVSYWMRKADGRESVRVEFPDGEERNFDSFADAEAWVRATERIVPSIIRIEPALPCASCDKPAYAAHVIEQTEAGWIVTPICKACAEKSVRMYQSESPTP